MKDDLFYADELYSPLMQMDDFLYKRKHGKHGSRATAEMWLKIYQRQEDMETIKSNDYSAVKSSSYGKIAVVKARRRCRDECNMPNMAMNLSIVARMVRRRLARNY